MDPDSSADSSGVPWAGRTLLPQPFAGDDGSAPAALVEALERRDAVAVVDALRPARVFVPVVAVLGEGEDASPSQGDKSADMALITLTGADGRRALPIFASTAALAAWDPSARPVPVEATRAALSGVAEGCDVLVLDPAGPLTFVVPRPAVWAMAREQAWTTPARDRAVLEAVAEAVSGVPGVVAHRCEDDGAAGLIVVLGLPAGLSGEQVSDVTGTVSAGLGQAADLAERVESVRLTVRDASAG